LSPAYDPAAWLGATAVAFLYAIALAGIGGWALRVVAGKQWPLLARTRLSTAAWSFTFGQGAVGVLWLSIGLWSRITTPAVWTVIAAGLLAAGGLAFAARRVTAPRLPLEYRATAATVAVIAALGVAGALLPTRADDALRNYLVMAQLIAHDGRVTFQAANTPMFGLFPLGQELHWAALLRVGNTASAAVFDALGSAATLAAIAVLAAAFGAGRRVQVLAVAIVATMPAYATLVGVLKVDNAATAFGVMAFAALAALGSTPRGALLSGLMLGFALGNRYTDALLVPSWLYCVWRLRPASDRWAQRPWACAAAGVLLAAGPSFLKNWILVREPFAPLFGGRDEFWSHAFAWRVGGLNLSWPDVPMLPLLWTFGERPMMMGTISPLYLGLLPAAFLLRRSALLRRAALPGLLGAIALATTVVGQPLSLHTRHHFVALALLAVLVGAAFVRFASSLRGRAWMAWLPVVGLLALWMAAAGWRALEAVKYLTGRKTSAAHYARTPGFPVAQWLSVNVPRDARVALSRFFGYRAFVRPDILSRSETRDELQAAWKARGFRPDYGAADWRETVEGGFSLVVLGTASVDRSVASWTAGPPPAIVYSDPQYTVLRLSRSGLH
jgi:hypothetical protein